MYSVITKGFQKKKTDFKLESITQGMPGIIASLALTKTLALIWKERLSEVPASVKQRVVPAVPCFASALGFIELMIQSSLINTVIVHMSKIVFWH